LEPYIIFDHEADAGFEVYGHTKKELFQNAADALFSLIMNLRTISPETERHIEIPENDESLIIFLNELLYLWDTEKFIPKAITIVSEGANMKALLKGEIFDEHRHAVTGAVKAVTYHKFSIQQGQGLLKATFIVDI
jgi:SHS2 domain-containing protein